MVACQYGEIFLFTAHNSIVRRTIVVFDLGGVLIDWDPRHLYRKLFPGDAAGMEHFLAEVCTREWNLQQDAGRSWAKATALLKAQHPEQATMIEAFYQRWPEMIPGAIEGTVAILRELKEAGTPLYALTNWSHETFPVARERFDFMNWFQGIVVPDPQIYWVLMERYGLQPENIVYVDDNLRNAEAASVIGMHALHFTNPAALRVDLTSLGFCKAAIDATSVLL